MSATSTYGEKNLFTRIAAGDEDAFRIFFDRYKEKLYYFISNIVKSPAEAEELVQDVFLRLWVSRHTLDDVANPSTYLFVMARNRSLDFIKKEKGDRQMKAELASQQQSINTTEEELAVKESRKLLEEAVRKLPSQQEKVFRLSREAGLNRDEIAARLNISPNTVRNHLSDALSSIRTYMKGKDEIILLILLTPIFGN